MSSEKPLRLHLGSGEKYLEGYVNIDYPQSEQNVITSHADVYADLRELTYPENSVDEIRSHHVFEHFSRAESLKLVMRWRSWLKPGGLLVIETPDFTTSAAMFLASHSMKRRFELARHIYGSQEAGWADHKDYWDKQKFSFVLGKTGFKKIVIRRYWNGLTRHGEKLPGVGRGFARLPESISVPILNVAGNFLPSSFYEKHGSNKMPNILARAQKDSAAKIDEESVARGILAMSLTGREGDEMLSVWMKQFREF